MFVEGQRADKIVIGTQVSREEPQVPRRGRKSGSGDENEGLIWIP